MEARKSRKNMTKEELLKEPNKHASLVIRYKEESLYLDAMFMSQHCGLVRDFIYQKEGRLALDDDGGGSVDSGVFVDNLCFQDDDDDSAPASKDEPAHAVKIRIPDGIRTVSWAAIVEVVLLCYDPLYASQDGCSLDSRPFEADDGKSARSESAFVDKYSLLKAAHFLQAPGVSRLIEKSLIRFLDKYLTKEAPQVRMSFDPRDSVKADVNVLDLVLKELARKFGITVKKVLRDFRICKRDPEQSDWKMESLLNEKIETYVFVEHPVPLARSPAS